MRIGIDARFLQGPNTGVTNYLANLLKSLSRIDRDNSYSIFLSDEDYNGKFALADNFKFFTGRAGALIWKNIWLPCQVKKLKIELMHFPAYTGSFVNIGKNVVTIHDLIHKVGPGWFCAKERLLLNIPIANAIKKADMIIAVSENTKSDIMKYYKVKEDKIAVTLEAADSSFRPVQDKEILDGVKKKYGIEGDFILYVGVLFKRRNVDRLLEAFSLLKDKQGFRHKLVIAGPGREYFRLDSYIDRYGIRDSVKYLGYVAQEDLPLLYNAAELFVYPSLYEGFGLPVLEAMSCGKPVITSNVSSLPEVLGDAGLLIDPYSAEDLSAAIFGLLRDSALRDELGKKALARSGNFNWDKMARQTLDIYKKASLN